MCQLDCWREWSVTNVWAWEVYEHSWIKKRPGQIDSENGIREVFLNRYITQFTITDFNHFISEVSPMWIQQLLFKNSVYFLPRVGRDGRLRHSSPHSAVDWPTSAPEVGTAKRCCCCCGCCSCWRVGKPWDWGRRRRRARTKRFRKEVENRGGRWSDSRGFRKEGWEGKGQWEKKDRGRPRMN